MLPLLIQYKILFLAIFLFRIFSDACDIIEIDDFAFSAFSLNEHAAVINLLYDTLYTAVIQYGNGFPDLFLTLK